MNLYVGNIPPSVKAADLQLIFGGMGQVLYASLSGRDKVQTEKGYAFVNIPNDDNARHAIASLNGSLLKGEKITVCPMLERPGVIGGTLKN